jgi:hypothetical protein
MEQFLTETQILNYNHPSIQSLVESRGWKALTSDLKKKAIYAFVRDEIQFGYNRDDSISASDVLADGYGQCNTKGALLMALLRSVNIPCRIHGFYVDKIMQKGAVTGLFYLMAPRKIIHSWVELVDEVKLTVLEGFILDKAYISALIQNLKCDKKQLCGFGASTFDLPGSIKDWDGVSDTYIQKESIVEDLGIFVSPDEFYKKYGSNLSGFKRWLFENYIRHFMNKNVDTIRNNKSENDIH